VILAELHGKLPEYITRWEDPLTSNVFSSFKYVDRKLCLKAFLEILSISDDFSDNDFEDADIIFWKTEKSHDSSLVREPDVVIKIGPMTIFVEAKYGSPLNERQLVEQCRIGSQFKDFLLICVTDGFVEPTEVESVRRELGVTKSELTWTSWQEIRDRLETLLGREEINGPSRDFVRDVVELMEKKGLTRFGGFIENGIDEEELREAQAKLDKFIRLVFTFTRELEDSLSADGIISAFPGNNLVETGEMKKSKQWQRWLVTEIGPYFIDKEWKTYKKNDCHAILYVWFTLSDPSVSIGYTFRLTKETRRSLRENVRKFAKYVEGDMYLGFERKSGQPSCEEKMVNEMDGDFFEGPEFQDTEFVDVCKYHPLGGRNFIEDVKLDIRQFLVMAKKLKLVPKGAMK
jgi:hypothetical protein